MGRQSLQRLACDKEGETMKIKYVHASEPTTEKIYDTVKAFNNHNNPRVFNTQQEFDTFELWHFAKDKEQGIILAYEVVEGNNAEAKNN